MFESVSAVLADSLIGIFYGDFYELTLLESQRASISSAAACMQNGESLEPLFTNQVGFAAVERNQAKAQLPGNSNPS